MDQMNNVEKKQSLHLGRDVRPLRVCVIQKAEALRADATRHARGANMSLAENTILKGVFLFLFDVIIIHGQSQLPFPWCGRRRGGQRENTGVGRRVTACPEHLERGSPSLPLRTAGGSGGVRATTQLMSSFALLSVLVIAT